MQTVLPKGADFQMRVIDSNIGCMKIIRVITPVWKTLTPAARILKILKAANAELSETERKDILRFSVLTPEEEKSANGKSIKKAPIAA